VFKPGFLFSSTLCSSLASSSEFVFKPGFLCSSSSCSSLATSAVQLCVQAWLPLQCNFVFKPRNLNHLTSRRNISSSFRAHLLCA
jgi:hypothetical protein